jgi:hypothetical protein
MAHDICCSFKPSKFARRCDTAEHTGSAGDVPARIIVRRGRRPADPAFGFHTEDERQDKVASADRPVFGERKDRRRHRRRGMDRGLGMRIVEVEDMRTDAVHQRGIEDVHAFGSSEQSCLTGTGEWSQCCDHIADRIVMAAADRASDPIEQRSLGFVSDGLGNIVKARRDDELRQMTRQTLRALRKDRTPGVGGLR